MEIQGLKQAVANCKSNVDAVGGLFEGYRKKREEEEARLLHPKASFSRDHSRYSEQEIDHRLPYKRDVDRIVHCRAYSRYIDKTQVVYLVDNDHITHRSLHVQLVANFARGIAEILGLNLDLVEAIALGHDVGHPPFGHEGEGYLSALSQEYGNGAFTHPLQSCRLLSEIEPLNLGLAVYDGFLCHDGGMVGNKLVPRFGKTWDDHFLDRKLKAAAPDDNIMPGTLEGCLVKLCDTMSYIGRDIEDAVSLKIIDRGDVPQTILGYYNRDILAHLSRDVIRSSYNQDYIAISQESYEALKVLRRFNFERIYTHPKLKVESGKIKRSYRLLFETLLEDLQANGNESYIWKCFLYKRTPAYMSQTSPVQMVIDYISGMTDNYFVTTLQKLFIPMPINLS